MDTLYGGQGFRVIAKRVREFQRTNGFMLSRLRFWIRIPEDVSQARLLRVMIGGPIPCWPLVTLVAT